MLEHITPVALSSGVFGNPDHDIPVVVDPSTIFTGSVVANYALVRGELDLSSALTQLSLRLVATSWAQTVSTGWLKLT